MGFDFLKNAIQGDAEYSEDFNHSEHFFRFFKFPRSIKARNPLGSNAIERMRPAYHRQPLISTHKMSRRRV